MSEDFPTVEERFEEQRQDRLHLTPEQRRLKAEVYPTLWDLLWFYWGGWVPWILGAWVGGTVLIVIFVEWAK